MNKIVLSLLLLISISLLHISMINGHEGIAIYVYDQPIVNDKIVVEDTYSDVPGWIVIYRDDNGELGTILGYSSINKWYTLYIVIELSKNGRTTTMHAMMHEDIKNLGEFEPELDPAISHPETPNLKYYETFNIVEELTSDLIVHNQEIHENYIYVFQAISPGPGWIVVFTDINGQPDEIIGKKTIFHGINDNVEVLLNDEGPHDKLHVFLYHDYRVAGEFEYPEIDTPVIKNDKEVSILIEIDGQEDKYLSGLTFLQASSIIVPILLLKLKKFYQRLQFDVD